MALLFDSGARAEEFLNIRYEDIEIPEKDNFVRLTLKEEYSKTKGRVISLYWKHSLELRGKKELCEYKELIHHSEVFGKFEDILRLIKE